MATGRRPGSNTIW